MRGSQKVARGVQRLGSIPKSSCFFFGTCPLLVFGKSWIGLGIASVLCCAFYAIIWVYEQENFSFVVLLFQGALEGSTGIRLLSKWKKRQCRGTFLFNEEIQKILLFCANMSQYAAFEYLFKVLKISAEKTQQRHHADYSVPLSEKNVAPWWQLEDLFHFRCPSNNCTNHVF